MSDNSLVSFATLDGGDDGEEVQTWGAGAYTGADDDAQGTCWIENSARARSRTGESAVRPNFDQAETWITTHDESLVGERVTRHLKQVALIEQRRLERSLLLGERGHLRRAQAAHPVQARRAQHRVDTGLREHAAVSHPGELVDPITIFELLDLGRYGRRIGGVAGEDFDRHRDALRRADQTKHDLGIVALAIAAVTAGRELAAAPGHPRGSEVVEHQRTTGQMLAGEALLDARLSLSQPVEGGIDLLEVNLAEVQQSRQRVGRGLGAPQEGG